MYLWESTAVQRTLGKVQHRHRLGGQEQVHAEAPPPRGRQAAGALAGVVMAVLAAAVLVMRDTILSWTS